MLVDYATQLTVEFATIPFMMKQQQALRQIRRAVRPAGGDMVVDTARGKGSHIIVRVRVGEVSVATTVASTVKSGTWRAIQGQLAPALGKDWA